MKRDPDLERRAKAIYVVVQRVRLQQGANSPTPWERVPLLVQKQTRALARRELRRETKLLAPLLAAAESVLADVYDDGRAEAHDVAVESLRKAVLAARKRGSR